MPNEQIETSHVGLEIMKEFNDCHLAYKIGGGSQSVSMMQGITDNLSAGFEAMWHPMEKRFIYNYGFKWVKDHHTILASYIPIARKDMFTVGYITRPNRHLQMFGEYKMGGQTSETVAGFKVAFNSGWFQGTINTGLKATSQTTFYVD